MSGIKIFNEIVSNPANYDVQGEEYEKSEKANADLQERFSNLLEAIEDFSASYAYDYFHAEGLEPEDLERHPEGLLEHKPIQNLQKINSDKVLSEHGLQFMDMVTEAAILLNCDTQDIYGAFGFSDKAIYETFGNLGIHKNELNDGDAIQILSGIHSEISAQLEELSTGRRSCETAISQSLDRKKAGAMYAEPSEP
ncbi:MAG: hypothetical protein ACLFR0_04610 [Alphaproteobacteria bacterium]